MQLTNVTGIFQDNETVEGVYSGVTIAGDKTFVTEYDNQGVAPEVIDDRPESVAFYAGRAWYGQGSDVYFSQVLSNKRKAAFCYQDSDPTSENISDLIDTDGGQIPIPEARRILRLVPVGGGVLAFAENGVWSVTGTSSGFSASSYQVSKVSSSGLEAPNSVVQAEGKVFWWSQTGIQGLEQNSGVFGPIEGSYNQTNVSQDTVQTLFSTTIPAGSKPFVKGEFDKASNTIQWLWKTSAVTHDWMYDRVLNLDLSLNAFYPWSISSDPAADGPYICGMFYTPNINEVTGASDVTLDDGTVITDDTGTSITTNAPSLTVRNRSLKFNVAVPSGTTWNFTHALFENSTYADWVDYSASTGYSYESFIEAGYEFFEDVMRNKQVHYVYVYMRKTENNFVDQGSGNYSADFPSSCKMRTKWDWADTQASNRWSREIEAYRHQRVPPVDTSDLTFDTGHRVVVTKNKVRGHGKTLQFRFSNSEIGKGFDILGWAVSGSGNTQT